MLQILELLEVTKGKYHMNLTEDKLIEKIKESFTDPTVKQLLINDKVKNYWFDINAKSKIHATGFCYLASEVFYNLNGKAKNWWFKELVSDKLPHNGYHYFLQHKETGRIVDLTKEQFGDMVIPYENGKSKGIRFASKNCNKLIKHLGLWEERINKLPQEKIAQSGN